MGCIRNEIGEKRKTLGEDRLGWPGKKPEPQSARRLREERERESMKGSEFIASRLSLRSSRILGELCG